MKLYEYEAFPSPRRVRMFLAEKGVEIPRQQIDVPTGEHRSSEFLSKNPDGMVPLLELDNGEFIAETVAISRYFEEKYPNNPLLGSDPEQKAKIEMWQRRIENIITNPVSTYFHHATEGLGEPDRYRNNSWGEKNREKATDGFKQLEMQLANYKHVVEESFSIVDITALCSIDFAVAINILNVDDYPNLKRWYAEVSQRQSAAA